jgi:hypothetical protein
MRTSRIMLAAGSAGTKRGMRRQAQVPIAMSPCRSRAATRGLLGAFIGGLGMPRSPGVVKIGACETLQRSRAVHEDSLGTRNPPCINGPAQVREILEFGACLGKQSPASDFIRSKPRKPPARDPWA